MYGILHKYLERKTWDDKGCAAIESIEFKFIQSLWCSHPQNVWSVSHVTNCSLRHDLKSKSVVPWVINLTHATWQYRIIHIWVHGNTPCALEIVNPAPAKGKPLEQNGCFLMIKGYLRFIPSRNLLRDVQQWWPTDPALEMLTQSMKKLGKPLACCNHLANLI